MGKSATGRYAYRWANADDDAALRSFLRETPMQGEVSLTLEREPNFYGAARVEGHVHRTVLAETCGSGQVAAIGSISLRDAWINGRIQTLGYLSQLRVANEHRHRPSLLRQGYEFAARWVQSLGVANWFTTILADNKPARRLLEAGLTGFPRYEPVGEYVTCVLSAARWRAGKDRGTRIRQASAGDLPTIRALLDSAGRNEQLSSAELSLECPAATDFFVAEHDDRALGCLAVWDQRAFKQVRVHGYSCRIARLRRLHNLLTPLTGQLSLPAVGSHLEHLYLSCVAVPESEPSVFAELLAAATQQAWQREPRLAILVGFEMRDPLLAVIDRHFIHRCHHSIVYRIYWKDQPTAETWGPGLFRLELATL